MLAKEINGKKDLRGTGFYGKIKSVLSCGSSSVVERQLPKLNVAGSNPVSRSREKSPLPFLRQRAFVISAFSP